MGFTPNAGVIMGTRTGDLDLGALLYICEKEGLNAAQANDLVNKKSGLQGVSEVSSDCRDLQAAAESGNDKARLALDILAYDVKKYVGSYAAALNGADLIVFTGGIGENDSEVREQVCTNMEYMGIHFDVAANKGVRTRQSTVYHRFQSNRDEHHHGRRIGYRDGHHESSEISYYFYIEKERSASQIVLFLYTFSHHA